MSNKNNLKSALLYQTQKLCQQYNIKPARSRGQNFLINEKVYNDIIDAADLKKNDVVLEVGPGLGFLTQRLALKVKKVIAVELDDKLAKILKSRLQKQNINNVEVINKNILDIPNTKYQTLEAKYKIIANLPYNITSIFLRKFLVGTEHCSVPTEMVLMLQKEVAERIIDKPPNMSLLAISVQFYANSEIIQFVKSQDFWPKPKVESAVIKLKIKNTRPDINEKDFFRLVKIGFSSRRKMLKNNLAGGYQISQKEAQDNLVKIGFNPKIRAQELSINDWRKILDTL